MAVFGYRVTDGSGRVTEGVIEAAGEAAARDRLRERSLTPIRVWAASAAQERKGGEAPSRGGGTRGVRKELLPFLQGFRTLLTAGVPMDRALEMMADLFRAGPMGPVAVSLLREVRAGSSLSDAMRKAPGAPFSRFLVQMVQAGQATGRLEEALDQAYRFPRTVTGVPLQPPRGFCFPSPPGPSSPSARFSRRIFSTCSPPGASFSRSPARHCRVRRPAGIGIGGR